MSQDSWEQLLKEAEELGISLTLTKPEGVTPLWTLATSVGWGFQKGTLEEMHTYLRETIIHTSRVLRHDQKD